MLKARQEYWVVNHLVTELCHLEHSPCPAVKYYWLWHRIHRLSRAAMQELLVLVCRAGLEGSLLKVYPMY